MKVAAFGRTQWLYDSIRAVAEQGHQIVLIGTCQAAPEYTVTEQDFARLARELDCAYFCDSAINRFEYVQMVKDSGAEVAISINWLTLIGEEMLDQFKYGVINAHAGDLPRFRGNAVPNWAILAGETKIVLTLHRMVTQLDAGPILLQRGFDLTPNTYIAEVYQFLEKTIPQMFVDVLTGLATERIIPKEQPSDPTLSLRCFPRLPRDGEIDWTQSAEDIARLVRASAEPFAGAYSFMGTEKITIWKAHSVQLPYPHLGVPGQVVEIRPQTGEVVVLTGEEGLAIEEAETNSHRRSRASEIVKSSRIRFDMDITQEILNLSQRVAQLEAQLRQVVEE